MRRHILVNLSLVGLTLLLCSVVYPLLLFGVGQIAFRHQAAGSLLDANGRPTADATKAVGSRLIAQPFTKDEYFQPRPSATSPNAYNAAASGASNWAASNYLLRDRVARALGPIITYRNGRPVGPDIETWFQKDRYRGTVGIVGQWAKAHTGLAQNWVKADPLNAEFVTAWMQAHSAEIIQWQKANQAAAWPKSEDLAVPFFEDYSRTHPGMFPVATGEATKKIEPAATGPDIQATFFDMWLQDHPQVELEQVPADLVMASGSGLDPHITLDNAQYQLAHRVAAAWADRLVAERAEPLLKAEKGEVSVARRQAIRGQVRMELAAAAGMSLEDLVRLAIGALLNDKQAAPLGGLAGVPMVNVLEVNLALRGRMERLLPRAGD